MRGKQRNQEHTKETMKSRPFFLDFILKEWLLAASAVGLVLTSVYARRFPSFSSKEFQVIFILAALFVSAKGLERSGLIRRLSLHFERGRFVALKLVLVTFFLSMVVTNDIALIVIVPLTLAINTRRKGIVVILEALAANAGSALTPFGNPQNLYIYWVYNVRATEFVSTIAPFSILFLILLVAVSFLVKTSSESPVAETEGLKISFTAVIYLILLTILVLTVLHILPVFAGIVVFLYAFLFDRNSLKIDFSLILTFVFFFGLANNLQFLIPFSMSHSGHIFLFSSLLSQVISNVPAALLIAKYTNQWQALLWGTNVGGFGSLVGSFANLIAYKLYITHDSTNNTASFTLKFISLGISAFFIASALYFILYGI